MARSTSSGPLPRLYSPDGRRSIVPTSKEEGATLRDDEGYTTTPPKNVATANSGAEGQRRARASSTTEGSETNTGSTTPDES